MNSLFLIFATIVVILYIASVIFALLSGLICAISLIGNLCKHNWCTLNIADWWSRKGTIAMIVWMLSSFALILFVAPFVGI